MPVSTDFVNVLKHEFSVLSKYKSYSGAYEIPMKELDTDVLQALLKLLKQGGFYITGIFCEDGSLNTWHEVNPLTDYYCVYHRRDMSDARTSISVLGLRNLFRRVCEKYNIDGKEYKGEHLNKTEYEYSIPLDEYWKDENIQKMLDELIYKSMFHTSANKGYELGLTVRKINSKDCFVLCELCEVGM